MSENEKNVPKRRFKEFENAEDWEQSKLGEIGTVQTCKRIFKEQTSESGDIPFYKNGTLGLKADAYISREVFEEYKELYPYPRVGDVLISVVGSIGRTAEYKGNAEYFQDSNIVWLKTDNNIIDKIFLKISYQIIDWLIEGSTIKHLYNDNILASKIWIPSSIDEQKAIGGFFDFLDNLITLHQRKLEKMKALKKAYLTDMFPAEGERKPKLRFAGFTDDWEQRKLGTCTGYRRGSFPQPYGRKEWYDGEGAMPFVQIVDVTSSLTLVDDTKQKISKLAQPQSVFVKEGSIVVTLQGSIGRVAITQYDAYFDRTILIFENYKLDIEHRFWAYLVQLKFDIEKRRAPGGTIKTITKEALSDFDMLLPKYEEQIKIGEFFKKIDHLITIHQRKLEKLQNVKKAYLNEMFI